MSAHRSGDAPAGTGAERRDPGSAGARGRREGEPADKHPAHGEDGARSQDGAHGQDGAQGNAAPGDGVGAGIGAQGAGQALRPRRLLTALRADLKESWTSLLSGGAARAMLTMAGGVFGARIFTAIGYLLIAWFYPPADYGAFSVYLGLAVILLFMGTAGYQWGIAAEQDRARALDVLVLSLLIATAAMALVLAMIGLALVPLAEMAGIGEARGLLYFLPLAAGLRIFHAVLVQWAIREGRFREQALSHLAFAGTYAAALGGLALAGHASAHGLVMADIAAAFAAFAVLAWREAPALLRAAGTHISRRRLWAAARRWRDLPRFGLPSDLIYSTGQQAPVFIAAAALGGGALLGQVAMALRLAELPLALINGALGGVATHHMRAAAPAERARQFARFTRQLLALGLAVYGAAAVALELGAVTVLGPEWQDVPIFFLLLVPVYVLNIVVVPVWYLFTLEKRIWRGLAFRGLYAGIIGAALAYAALTGDLPGALGLFSLLAAAVWALALLDLRWLLGRRAGRQPRAQAPG